MLPSLQAPPLGRPLCQSSQRRYLGKPHGPFSEAANDPPEKRCRAGDGPATRSTDAGLPAAWPLLSGRGALLGLPHDPAAPSAALTAPSQGAAPAASSEHRLLPLIPLSFTPQDSSPPGIRTVTWHLLAPALSHTRECPPHPSSSLLRPQRTPGATETRGKCVIMCTLSSGPSVAWQCRRGLGRGQECRPVDGQRGREAACQRAVRGVGGPAVSLWADIPEHGVRGPLGWGWNREPLKLRAWGQLLPPTRQGGGWRNLPAPSELAPPPLLPRPEAGSRKGTPQAPPPTRSGHGRRAGVYWGAESE